MNYPVRHGYSSLIAEKVTPWIRGTFIETGTNLGQGIDVALKCGAKRIFSVEEDSDLFAESFKRYAHDPRVSLHLGDSPDFLRRVLPTISEEATIYLDAHSIERNPLLGELSAIAEAPIRSHVVMIDDVRMFGTPDWHGLTKEEALESLRKINEDYSYIYVDTNHGGGDLLVAYVK